MNIDQLRARLKRQFKDTTAAAWARSHGLAPSYVSDVMNGRRDPGEKILDALGLERVFDYREKVKS